MVNDKWSFKTHIIPVLELKYSFRHKKLLPGFKHFLFIYILLRDQQIWWSSKECNQNHWIKVLLKYFANWKSSKVTNNLYWKVLSQKYTCLSFLIFWFSNKMWQFDLLSSFVYVTCSFDHFFKVIICLLYLIIGKNTKNLCLCFNLKSDLLSMYFLIN